MFHPLFHVAELCFIKHLMKGTLEVLFTHIQTHFYKMWTLCIMLCMAVELGNFLGVPLNFRSGVGKL